MTQGIIALNDIHIYGCHGCSDEEQSIGREYVVSIELTTDVAKAMKTDHLDDTIDYVVVNDVIRNQMKKPAKLMEHLIERIHQELFNLFPLLSSVTTEIKKMNPPFQGDCHSSSVKIKQDRL